MFKWLKSIFRKRYWLVWPTGKGVKHSWIEKYFGQPMITPLFTVSGPVDTLKEAMLARESILAKDEGREFRSTNNWEARILSNICELIDEGPEEHLGLTKREISIINTCLTDAKKKERENERTKFREHIEGHLQKKFRPNKPKRITSFPTEPTPYEIRRKRAIEIIKDNPKIKPKHFHTQLKAEFGKSISVTEFARIRQEFNIKTKKRKAAKKAKAEVDTGDRILIL